MKGFCLYISFCFLLLIIGSPGCTEEDMNLVSISDIVPNQGAEGMRIRILGQNFGNRLTDHRVTFNGQEAIIEDVSDQQIIAIAPPGVTEGKVVLTTRNSSYDGPVFSLLDEEVALEGGFSINAGLATIGSAFVYEDEEHEQTVLRLTPPKLRRVGIAYYGTRIPVIAGFETSFDFRLHQADAPAGQSVAQGAEGFAFIIQNQGINARGHMGPSIGYAGIRNSVAVEFDIHQNQEVHASFDDPDSNHISVQTNTTTDDRFGETGAEVYHSLGFVYTESLPNLVVKKGENHRARIIYMPDPGKLKVYLNDKEVLSVDMLLSEFIDTEDGKAYVGFTSSTGEASGWTSHDILNWSFEPVYVF